MAGKTLYDKLWDAHEVRRGSYRPSWFATHGRHDPCVGIRATPIAEAMLAIVLMDHLLRNRAQNLDVRSPTPVVPAAKQDSD